MVPGEAYEVTITLYPTANLFARGHRIRLDISSSNFPRFDRNTNSGGEIGSDSAMNPALQTVVHTSEYPSRVTLPVVPR
jgi:putative CocE/NonD family hydrolase